MAAWKIRFSPSLVWELLMLRFQGHLIVPYVQMGLRQVLYALESELNWTYEWFMDGLFTGDTDPILSTNEAGDYFVIVYNSGGCADTSDVFQLRSCAEVGGECVNGLCLLDGNNGCVWRWKYFFFSFTR